MISFEIIRPTENHAKLILEWRNDPSTLQMSFHTQPKEFSQFWDSFVLEYFSIPELPPLFIVQGGSKVGILRFRKTACQVSNRKSCEISINLAPEYRGKGLGSLALHEISSWVKQQGFDDIYAEIKKGNLPSIKAFKSAHYEHLGSFEKIVRDTKESVIIQRFIRKLTPTSAFDQKVFIIAEAGSNWKMGSPEKDLAMAKTLIDVAKDAGADAVKFQVFNPEMVYVKNAGISSYLAKKEISQEINHLLQELAMPHEMIPELANYCKQSDIEFLASSFSENDFLAIDPFVKYHKIASYEISHLRLIERAAESGKPLILSTGASNEDDIQWAIKHFYESGGTDLTLLQCTAKYPAPMHSMNLNAIATLKHHFCVGIGLSDHSRDSIAAPLAAVAMGARIIEKHFTLSNELPGPDHSFAILPKELKYMVQEIRQVEQMRGTGIKEILNEEIELHDFARRGLQALKEIKIGDKLRENESVGILRPGNQRLGIHPKFLKEIEGSTATRDIPAGDGIFKGDWQ